MNSETAICSIAKAIRIAMSEVNFIDYKILGVRLFDTCNDFLFSVNFESCILNLSSFFKFSLRKTDFRDCSLQEVDFSGCNLSGAVFNHCDLINAVSLNTLLEEADFRTFCNYFIDPELNKIKKVKFTIAGTVWLLGKYGIEIY